MMRKIIKKAGALLIVGMTMVGMLGTAITTVNAADNTYSVDINNVEFDEKYSQTEAAADNKASEAGVYKNRYHIVDPIVKIPSTKKLTYMTINVRNGYFDTSALSAWGVHHYNAGGTSSKATSDLVIFSDADHKTAAMIEQFLENMPLYQDYSDYYAYSNSIGGTPDRLQIEVEISENAISIPEGYSYNYYKDIDTQKTYLYLYNTTGDGLSWHEAYNKARTVEFSNMRGYLMADSDVSSSNFSDRLLRAGGYSSDENPAGWVGVTSLYSIADGTSVSTYDSNTWKKNTDGLTWETTISGSKYISPMVSKEGLTAAETDDTVTAVNYDGTSYLKDVTVNAAYWDKGSTTQSATAASTKAKLYYLADGPSTGTNFTDHTNWYVKTQLIQPYTYRYGDYYQWYSNSFYIYHYLPDDIATTHYDTALTRADSNATKLDCAVFYKGGLADSAEADVKKAFYVEFTPDATYSKAFATGNITDYQNGNAKTLYNADKNYTADSTKTCFFKTYLLMDDDAAVPSQYFYYTVESAEGTADNKIFTGIDNLTATGRITEKYYNYDSLYYQASDYFTAADYPTTEYSAGSSTDQSAISNATQLKDFSHKKYVVADTTIDFTRVVFHEPGTYRFKITAYHDTEKYIQYDSTSTMYLDVYVESVDGSDTLQIKDYTFHTIATETEPEVKRPYFVNQYLTKSLTVTKNVSGNQARLDQDFQFSVYFTSTANNAKIQAVFTDTSTTGTGGLNSTMATNGITTTADYWISANGGYMKDDQSLNIFYLKANQSVTFKGVPYGVYYKVYENKIALAKLGYTPSLKTVDGDNNNTYNEADSTSNALVLTKASDSTYVYDTGMTKDTTLTINNEKDGLVPTGIIVTVAPYAALALGGFFGLILFARHKKNEDEDDDSDQANLNHKH